MQSKMNLGLAAPVVLILFLFVIVVMSGPPAWADQERVTDGLQVLYTFEEGSGTTVKDVSGVGKPLNLTIADTSAVSWSSGSLAITDTTIVTSTDVATKVITTTKKSNELTIEAWIKPAQASQGGPARIVTLSQDTLNRNFTLGHGDSVGNSADIYDVRLRNKTENTNGANPSLSTVEGTVATTLTHVVYTFDTTGTAKMFIDGTEVISQAIGGDASTWNETYHLALANEMTYDESDGNRPWLGEYHLVAIYSRALSAAEVLQNYNAGHAVSAIPTATPTDVPTATPTDVPTATPTDVPTATPTDVPTVTPTAIPEATATPTDVPTATPTSMEEATSTPTSVLEVTPTPASVLEVTPTPTSVLEVTPTPTNVYTGTITTPTPTPTGIAVTPTPTNVYTGTITTPTPTPTGIAVTPTPTNVYTGTITTPTPTPTGIAVTPTPIVIAVTSTPTDIPIATGTPIAMPTATGTPIAIVMTSTPTDMIPMATFTPTSVPIVTNTPTRVLIATDTPTNTVIVTSTVAPDMQATATPTDTMHPEFVEGATPVSTPTAKPVYIAKPTSASVAHATATATPTSIPTSSMPILPIQPIDAPTSTRTPTAAVILPTVTVSPTGMDDTPVEPLLPTTTPVSGNGMPALDIALQYPHHVDIGEEIPVTIVYSNSGYGIANNMSIIIVVPDYMHLNTDSNSGWQPAANAHAAICPTAASAQSSHMKSYTYTADDLAADQRRTTSFTMYTDDAAHTTKPAVLCATVRSVADDGEIIETKTYGAIKVGPYHVYLPLVSSTQHMPVVSTRPGYDNE